MAQADNLGFGTLLDAMLRLARQHFLVVAMVVLGLTVADLIFVRAMPDLISILPTLVLQFFVFYHFCEHLLADELPAGEARLRRYGALFFGMVLSGIAILFGLVLLVIPGIYLMARWTLIAPLVITEQRDGMVALNQSWDITARSDGVLVAMLLATAAPTMGVSMIVDFATEGVEGAAVCVSEVVISLGNSIWFATNAVMSVAAYRLLRIGRNAISEVFA